MIQNRSRPDAGARGAAMVDGLGGLDRDDTAKTPETEGRPRVLLVEAGAVRAATVAELRRAAALGMIGGRA